MKNWFLVVVVLVVGYWISIGTPNPLLFINISTAKENCLMIAEMNPDKVRFSNNGEIFVRDTWIKKGKIVVSLFQRNDNDSYRDVLCLADTTDTVGFPGIFQQSNWR